MAVFPEHQYRGAGTMLTAWGTHRADEINALVNITSSSVCLLLLINRKVFSRSYNCGPVDV